MNDPNSDGIQVMTEYLKTGMLGKLHLGMSLDDIIAYMGIPDEHDPQTFDKSELYKQRIGQAFISYIWYGILELVIERTHDTLISMQIDLDAGLSRDIPLPIGNEWVLTVDGMSHHDFIAFLQTHQIDWYEEQPKFAHAFFMRILPSCIGVSFNIEDGVDKLYSIIKAEWTSNCSSTTTY